MEGYKCIKEEIIRQLEIDIAVLKSDIANVKEDISDMKDKMDNTFKAVVAALFGIVSTMAMVLYNILTGAGG